MILLQLYKGYLHQWILVFIRYNNIFMSLFSSVGAKVSRLPDDCKKIVSEDGCYEQAVKISDNRSLCTYGVGMVGR